MLRAGVFGKPDQESAARARRAQRGHALLDGDAEAAMEQQVFGRITRQRELGQHQEVGRELAAGALGRGHDGFRVARDVAHEQIQLPEGDAQFVRRCHPGGALFRAPRLGGPLLR